MLISSQDHQLSWWLAPAPLGHVISRAYRLIEYLPIALFALLLLKQ